jgi:hypothetical protein
MPEAETKWSDVAHAQIPVRSAEFFREGETDVDDDDDAIGQREVITELTLHYIEVLTLAREDSESYNH